ncbi:hypothetical protein CRUP_037259 [Coryphaenoides rupestris]|nr:hypothetical protein CRUP_037259 [Coryphaenoides rupestris]
MNGLQAGTHGQSVEMDTDMSGYVGSKVDLRCRFLNSSPPVKISQMSLSSPTLVARASSVKIPVATCTSANGKPPGTIRWETRVPGEATSREFRNADGTFTVQSEYALVPSRATHQESLTCVSTYNDDVFTDSVTLDIQCRQKKNAEANPGVTLYQWKLVNGTMPGNVAIQDNTLTFSGPLTYDLDGTYACEATNSIGTRSAAVVVSIIEKPLPQVAAGDVISVVALLLAAGVLMGITVTVLVLKIRSRKDDDSSESPSSKPSQPLRKRPGDDIQHAGKCYEELPNTADYVSYRLACNKEDYPEPYSPPIHPPLSFLPQHPDQPTDSAPSPAPAATLAIPANVAKPAATSNHVVSGNTFVAPSHTTAAVFKYPTLPGMTSSPPPPGVAPYTFPKEQYV